MDVVAMQGIAALNFGLVFSLLNGVTQISNYVGMGNFDRFLLSPKNLLLRICVSKFGVSALGDVLFGFLCLCAYILIVKISAVQMLLLATGVIISSFVMFSMMLLSQAVSFFLMDPRSGTRGLFELFLTPSLFHGGAFQGGLRLFFTFIIPALLTGALPVDAVRNISWPQLGFIALLASLWLLISIWFFYKGVRRYESANLTTFGT
jgi:ABC-2 type transport system permease protein